MKRGGKWFAVSRRVFFGLLLFVGALSFFAAKWYIDVYGQTGFDSVLFSLFSGVDDVQSGLITAFLEEALFPAAVATVLVGGVFWFASDRRIVLRLGKKVRVPIFPMHRAVSGLLSAAFCGRVRYFTHHGVDAIYDVDTAKAEGYIAEDYWVLRGMEDECLYAYAKDKIAGMAADGQPFAFTMLTADTHHVGGYHCDLCGSEYAEDYENVYACASRQLAALLGWIQAQDFYENTTVFITGDHPSMDGE